MDGQVATNSKFMFYEPLIMEKAALGLVIFRISIDSINGASMAHIPEIGGTFTVFLVS